MGSRAPPVTAERPYRGGSDRDDNDDNQGRGGVMAILVVLVLVVVGAAVLILPALLPGIVIAGLGYMIYRSVERHHHAV